MSITKLQDKVFEVTNPVEIDFAIEEIRKFLKNNLSWVSHAFHIAHRFYKKTDKGSFYYPETFVKDLNSKNNSYHRLTPDNDYKGMFFFVLGTGRIKEENTTSFITYPVSIIFSVNLELIDKARLNEYLFTQELIASARKTLRDAKHSFEFGYELKSETKDLKEVYKEFVLDEIEQYNRAPLQCFRFDLELTIEEDCLKNSYCENEKFYVQMSNSFHNPFSPSLQTDIRQRTPEEIEIIWLDNENFSTGIGGLNVYICSERFEVGTEIRTTNNNELLSSLFDGYWLANQSGASGNGILNGQLIEYRYNPSRTSPFGINNPIENAPIPLTFWADTIEPVILKMENSIITEIIPLPMTGFSFE